MKVSGREGNRTQAKVEVAFNRVVAEDFHQVEQFDHDTIVHRS